MSPREAREIAAWLRQVHGDSAEAFCLQMIKHFQKENSKVLPQWDLVLCTLEAEAVSERQYMVPSKMNGHDRRPSKFNYFPEDSRQDR